MKHDFQYISNHNEEVKERYKNIINFLNEVQDIVREKFTFNYYVIGSYKRNMITYDRKSNIGYDFDFNIEVNDEEEEFTAKQIKEILINGMRKVSKKYGYDYPENSTRVITIKMKDNKNSRVLHSCDFAIVYNFEEDREAYQQYIRFNKNSNDYEWCYQGNEFYLLPDKIGWIKENDLWGEVRERYIYFKNNNEDNNVHSRSIFAMTISDICNRYGYLN